MGGMGGKSVPTAGPRAEGPWVPGGEPQNAAHARGVSRRLYQTLDIPKVLPLALA